MNRIRKCLGNAGSVGAIFAAFFALGTFTLGAHAAEPDVKAGRTVPEIIQKALSFSHNAHTADEIRWADRGIDTAFSAILRRAPEQQAEACPALERFKDPRDLILLERVILNPDFTFLAKCRASLQKSVEGVFVEDLAERNFEPTTKFGAAHHPDSETKAAYVRSSRTVPELIDKAIYFAHTAKTSDEQHWAFHGMELAFATIRERPADQQAEACNVLRQLENKRDLILLERAIVSSENTYLNDCRGDLLKTVEDLYEKDRQELKATYGELPSPDAQATKSGERKVAGSCAGKVGNYPPIEIDTAGGPSFGSYSTGHGSHHIAKPPGLAPKEVIFTMDDGPSPGRTEKALAAFEENCVHATMFQVGQFMASSAGQAIVKKELDAGHNVGNHTWSHPLNMARLSEGAGVTELTKQSNLMDTLLQKFKQQTPGNASRYVKLPFFRFPGGNEASGVLNYLHAQNMPNFTWQAGANDWLPRQTPQTELQEALRELTATNGGIFICHDTHQATVDMIPYLLVELQRRGFKVRHMIPRGSSAEATGDDPSSANDNPPETQPTDSGSANFTLEVVTAWKDKKVTADGIVKKDVNIRTPKIKESANLGPSSLYQTTDGRTLLTSDLASVTLTGNVITVNGKKFAEAAIDEANADVNLSDVSPVYIWVGAIGN